MNKHETAVTLEADENAFTASLLHALLAALFSLSQPASVLTNKTAFEKNKNKTKKGRK